MKTKKYIIKIEDMNCKSFPYQSWVNFEWRNGRKHPESFWSSNKAQQMTQSQKEYISQHLINNGISHCITEII